MSIYSLFAKKGPSGFGYGSTAENVTEGLSLEGKSILVTGCNSGLGLESMRVLSMRGARVTGTARTIEKATEACAATGERNLPVECELSEPDSVRKAVARIKKEKLKFDAIICNAGIMALPERKLAHGYEMQFFTNHIGHFMLVTGLLENLADHGRVVILSSAAHSMAPPEGIIFDDLAAEKKYSAWTAYGQSKMANILFAKELSRKFQGTKKTANAVHPGVIRTNLGRYMNPAANFVFGLAGPLMLKTAQQGAATEVFAAVHPWMEGKSGHYLADCNIAPSRQDADDPVLASRLWEKSEEIVRSLA